MAETETVREKIGYYSCLPIAFVMFITIAVYFILTDTKGLRMPRAGETRPLITLLHIQH